MRNVSAGLANVFEREGDYWTIVFQGKSFRLKDTKGLRYLGELLQNPGREFHVLELIGTEAAGPVDVGDAGVVLDAQAKSEYRRRAFAALAGCRRSRTLAARDRSGLRRGAVPARDAGRRDPVMTCRGEERPEARRSVRRQRPDIRSLRPNLLTREAAAGVSLGTKAQHS